MEGRMMADDEENTTDQTTEPDELKLWRELISVRDAFVAEERTWSNINHPLRENARLHLELRGVPESVHADLWAENRERSLKKGDEWAKNRANLARRHVQDLDAWINDTTRWKGSGGRGRTLNQLEEFVSEQKRLSLDPKRPNLKQKAIDTIANWLHVRTGESRQELHEAALWLWMYEHDAPDTHPSQHDEIMRRLVELEAADRANRGEGTAMPEIRAKRILSAAKVL
jgi:hypothetical protein